MPTPATSWGVPLYQSAAAFMQRPAARRSRRSARSLHKIGYGLLIHDAYRPWFVTKMFWDATPPANHQFVAIRPKARATIAARRWT